MPASLRASVLVPTLDYPEPYDWALRMQAEAIEAAGISVVPRAWTEPDIGDGVDLVLPIVAWGYHHRFAQWMALLDRLEDKRIPVLNPVGLLRWNSDKAYLAELAAKGVPTVPTITVDALDEAALIEARAQFACSDLVVKPPISAGADGTFRLGPDDGFPDAVRDRRMLIQPFQRAIVSQGELSLMIFGGEPSHAIMKRARTGEFRVQPQHGGREEIVAAPPDAVDLATRALAAAPEAATYARVDMISDDNGKWQIMELELIEPALWLNLAPGSAERFGTSIRVAAEQILAQR